ncbi:MAG: O-methyltransferase [Candidatus Acidiferrales bacterium]
MPGILEPAVERYLSSLLPEREPVLADMERYAKQHDIPIIGPDCGRLLSIMAQISGAKRIFEMGSAIGYSAIWFARAAGPTAEIYCTDGDPANADLARKNFETAGVAKNIRFMTGEAVDLIDSVEGDFDIILIDVYKHQYPAALKKSLPRLKSGALLITDNVLWSGRVTQAPKDDPTRGVLEFNRMIYSSPELFSVIVPLRDGVAICRKT